jgi:hypothetical protein
MGSSYVTLGPGLPPRSFGFCPHPGSFPPLCRNLWHQPPTRLRTPSLKSQKMLKDTHRCRTGSGGNLVLGAETRRPPKGRQAGVGPPSPYLFLFIFLFFSAGDGTPGLCMEGNLPLSIFYCGKIHTTENLLLFFWCWGLNRGHHKC